MILVPFFASSTVYGSTKNLLSLPFQAPVFFGYYYCTPLAPGAAELSTELFILPDFWKVSWCHPLRCVRATALCYDENTVT